MSQGSLKPKQTKKRRVKPVRKIRIVPNKKTKIPLKAIFMPLFKSKLTVSIPRVIERKAYTTIAQNLSRSLEL